MLEQKVIDNYIAILREELVLATGCTEPIAIAYCAAKVQKLLACPPERITAVLSGNILKNVKSVVVPNTGGRKGIRPAIAAGMVAGDESKDLQVIADIPEEKFSEIEDFLHPEDRVKVKGEVTFDTFDNMTEIVRGDGMKYALAYDAFHSLESIGIEGKPEQLVKYNYKKGSGRLKSVTYANGNVMYATYNSIGQMIGEEWKDVADGNTIAKYKYSYDGSGNIVRSLDILPFPSLNG